MKRSVVSVFVAVVVASILAPLAAQAASQPSIVAAKGSPHAGRTFIGVVTTVPKTVKVLSFFCKATIGGHMKRTSTGGGKVYVGGTYIKPIIHKSYAHGRLARATCGWPIPSSAAGKLLSLAQPGCMMDCGPWGFAVHFLDLTRPAGEGQNQTTYRYGPTWTIRS